MGRVFSRISAFAALCALCALCAAAAPCAAADRRNEYFINIVFTGNESAAFEPCTCPGKPNGGSPRKTTVIKGIRRTDANVLVMDSGDFMSRMPNQLQNDYAVKLSRVVGYDFIFPGNQEFIMGTGFFKSMKGLSTFVLSNLKTSDRKLAKTVKPYSVVKIGGLKVGLIGVIEADSFTHPAVPEGMELTDPVRACADYAEKLRGKTDVIIAGVHANEGTVGRIAAEVPGIAVILAGHSPKHMTRPDKIEDTFVLWPGTGGKTVGKFKLKLDANRQVTGYENTYVELEKRIQDDPEARKLADEYTALTKKQNEQLTIERNRHQ